MFIVHKYPPAFPESCFHHGSPPMMPVRDLVIIRLFKLTVDDSIDPDGFWKVVQSVDSVFVAGKHLLLSVSCACA